MTNRVPGERHAKIKSVTPDRLRKLIESVDRPGIQNIAVDVAPDGTVKIRATRSPAGETDGQEALRRRQERKQGLRGDNARAS